MKKDWGALLGCTACVNSKTGRLDVFTAFKSQVGLESSYPYLTIINHNRQYVFVTSQVGQMVSKVQKRFVNIINPKTEK